MDFESTIPFALFILFVLINLILRAIAIGRKKRVMEKEERGDRSPQKNFLPGSSPYGVKTDQEEYLHAQESTQAEGAYADELMHPVFESIEGSQQKLEEDDRSSESIPRTVLPPQEDMRKDASEMAFKEEMKQEMRKTQTEHKSRGNRLWKRIERLSPLQKAVVLSEILGKSKGLD